MSTRQKVIDQLDKAMAAHRTAHHASVLRARRHRERLQADLEKRPPVDTNIQPPDEQGLISGDTVDPGGDLAGLG